MFRESPNNFPDVFIDHRIEPRKSSLHGIGIFAKEDIPARTLIERSATIKFPLEDMIEMEEKYSGWHPFSDYVFLWPICKNGGQMVFALGFGSLYNHSSHNDNVTSKPNTQIDVVEFTTMRDIKTGEELMFRYIPRSAGGDEALWDLPFEVTDIPDDIDLG